jgi:hypothetical protein
VATTPQESHNHAHYPSQSSPITILHLHVPRVAM